MKIVPKEAKNTFELIIRPNNKTNPRKWWINQYFKIKKLLLKHLPEEKRNLLKYSTLTLLLTNNKEIQKLNKKFRNKNKPADVLSFPLKGKEQKKQKYLGDIIISTQQGKGEKLLLLFIHGYLHLLGYDHMTYKEEKIMFRLQDKILKYAKNKSI